MMLFQLYSSETLYLFVSQIIQISDLQFALADISVKPYFCKGVKS